MFEIHKYLKKFEKLKRGPTKYGPAPHKPILLLSVLQAFQSKIISTNRIEITPELVYLFKSNWTNLVTTNHVCNFALPFFHLKGEKFWHLIPKPGFEPFVSIKESISSLSELNGTISFAILNNDLFELFIDDKNNGILQQHLLDQYFKYSRVKYHLSSVEQLNYFNKIEGKILHEDAEKYRTEIKSLMNEKNEEEIFLRGSVFKREVPKIYNYTCCISGMKIDTSLNISMIDACHITPFSQSFDDTISNGIALCPNLHRAFDRGLISIDDNYRVIISNLFIEDESVYEIKKFKNNKVLLPNQESYFPLKQNLAWHRENIFKN